MEKIKQKFIDAVAGQLSAAPPSTAKDELVEELSDNLYRRFLDMTGAGMPEEEAFRRSMDDLGDVEELLRYLGSESRRGGGDAGSQRRQGDLDAILSEVQSVCSTAIDQTKAALRQAKQAIQRRTTVQRDSGRVRVQFNTHPDGAPRQAESPEESGASASDGWEFEAELDPGGKRFFAGGGPREKKNTVYGFGYDKAKGGFYTQWGDGPTGERGAEGPHFSGEDASMTNNDDGSYSVTALRDLRGIEVFTGAGDVAIHMSEGPDAGVIIDGDVDDLDVTCSADGVLTIREGRTASFSFLSLRGFRAADVELFLPRRRWESITVNTASGDVDIDRYGLEAESLIVSTASGDLNVRLLSCQTLSFKSASGDLDLEGDCAQLTAETMSGDISLRGRVKSAALKTASGDIDLEGAAVQLQAQAMSGDVNVVTAQMPQAMDLSSKSGDCEARIPDAGPFRVQIKTVTGSMNCDFPVSYSGGTAVCGDGSGPNYSITSVSGDVSLERY